MNKQNKIHLSNPKQKKSPWVNISAFLLVTTTVLGALYYSKRPTQFRGMAIGESYTTLKLSVKQGGLVQFQKDKGDLRSHIESILQNPKNEEEETDATNVALYLFPDLLPDSHFEKQIALELWAPLESAIEKKPRSSEARVYFEELKSHIWNYENPKLSSVGLSTHALETLSIYHELSSP